MKYSSWLVGKILDCFWVQAVLKLEREGKEAEKRNGKARK